MDWQLDDEGEDTTWVHLGRSAAVPRALLLRRLRRLDVRLASDLDRPRSLRPVVVAGPSGRRAHLRAGSYTSDDVQVVLTQLDIAWDDYDAVR